MNLHSKFWSVIFLGLVGWHGFSFAESAPCRYEITGNANSGWKYSIEVKSLPGMVSGYDCTRGQGQAFDCKNTNWLIGSPKMPAGTLVLDTKGNYIFQGTRCGSSPSFDPVTPAESLCDQSPECKNQAENYREGNQGGASK